MNNPYQPPRTRCATEQLSGLRFRFQHEGNEVVLINGYTGTEVIRFNGRIIRICPRPFSFSSRHQFNQNGICYEIRLSTLDLRGRTRCEILINNKIYATQERTPAILKPMLLLSMINFAFIAGFFYIVSL